MYPMAMTYVTKYRTAPFGNPQLENVSVLVQCGSVTMRSYMYCRQPSPVMAWNKSRNELTKD